jgi:hypothetical protein
VSCRWWLDPPRIYLPSVGWVFMENIWDIMGNNGIYGISMENP